MASRAWNSDGDVPTTQLIPLGAVRKALLTYKNKIKNISKLILNGVSYDFKKQAKDGIVVIGPNYSSITFFLPDDKEPLTLEDGHTYSLLSYLSLLGETDYSSITAWDYFAKFIGETLGALTSQDEATLSEIAYAIYCNNADGELHSFNGIGSFSSVQSARDFFYVICSTIDSAAENAPLYPCMESDGAVSIHFVAFPDTDNQMSMPLIVGRK